MTDNLTPQTIEKICKFVSEHTCGNCDLRLRNFLNSLPVEDGGNTCGSCGNAVGLWCDRWDAQRHDNQTCNDWSKIHWCIIAPSQEE